MHPNSQSLRLGVVMRKTPGVTRWAEWVWKAVSVLPGAGDSNWKLLRSEGDIAEYHAATLDLTLYVSDTEAYVHELAANVPSVYVILRPATGNGPADLEAVHVTVSPYEAQDYCDSGEEVVEKVAMPQALLAAVHDYVDRHHVDEPFVKRQRNKARTDQQENGVGDTRISQATDVYRAPTATRHAVAE